MSDTFAELVKYIAYFGLMVGLLGTIAPIIPGPPIVWLSAVLWAWADGFEHVGWPTLILMGALALLASISDILLSTWGSRRSGAAWSSLVVSGVAAVAGFLVWNLPGALIGAVIGMLAAESRRLGGDMRQALRVSRGMLIGYLLAMVLQLGLVALMLLIFTLQAFSPP